MTWQDDKAWTDPMLRHVAVLCAPVLFGPAEEEDDRQRNTDLRVIVARDVRIAVRIRRHHYYRLYREDITVRASRPNGSATELRKIMDGWGDYLFYGFANQDSTGFLDFPLIDLAVFRVVIRDLWKQRSLQQYHRRNADGTEFYAFPRALFVQGIALCKEAA